MQAFHNDEKIKAKYLDRVKAHALADEIIQGQLRVDYKKKSVHPTQKPVEGMKYLLKLALPYGGSVLDPFAGSGSTGVAATDLGLKFTGIEREEKYFKIAQDRMNDMEGA